MDEENLPPIISTGDGGDFESLSGLYSAHLPDSPLSRCLIRRKDHIELMKQKRRKDVASRKNGSKKDKRNPKA